MNRIITNLIYAICCIAIVSTVSSCKSDKGEKSMEDLLNEETITLDFSINGEVKPGADRIGQDISEVTYNEDPMNEDYVMHITIGDSIYFKDKSNVPPEVAKNRKWFINTQELEQTGPEVAWYSDIVSNIRVTLKYSNDYVVQKGIYLKEDLGGFEDFMEEENAEDSEAADALAEEEVFDPYANEPETKEPVKEPAKQTATAAKSEKPASKPKVEKPKVEKKKVEIKNVDFSASFTTVEAGKGVLFRDQSVPASAINVRVWDFGDGINMTTRGSSVQHAFAKEGNYTVKLCLNYSSKCYTKDITVTPAKTVLVATKPKKKETPKAAKPVEKPKVSKVYFSLPTTGKVGRPIVIEDTSIPSSAVSSRSWFVNGSNIGLTNKRLSRTFDKPGKYTVKLCVNGSSTDCHSSNIEIAEEKKVVAAPTKKVNTAEEEEFLCFSTARGGMRSAQRCPSADKKYVSTKTTVKLKPQTTMELRNATIYGSDVGYVDIVLKATDGSLTKRIKNAQVLPGRSIIELGTMAVTLEKGKMYTLDIIPPSDGSLELEDGGSCNSQFNPHKNLEISYEGNKMVLMDIKFCF